MKQAIENLTMLFVNKKPINILVKIFIFLFPVGICLVIYNEIFITINSENYPKEIMIVEQSVIFIMFILSIIFYKNIISNFLEDKKGAIDYIGYDSNYIQYRLPEYKISPLMVDYHLMRKKEDNILIAEIQKIELKPHYLMKKAFSTKIEISVIFTTHNLSKKLLMISTDDEVNNIIEQFKQFANKRNIELKV